MVFSVVRKDGPSSATDLSTVFSVFMWVHCRNLVRIEVGVKVLSVGIANRNGNKVGLHLNIVVTALTTLLRRVGITVKSTYLLP